MAGAAEQSLEDMVFDTAPLNGGHFHNFMKCRGAMSKLGHWLGQNHFSIHCGERVAFKMLPLSAAMYRHMTKQDGPATYTNACLAKHLILQTPCRPRFAGYCHAGFAVFRLTIWEFPKIGDPNIVTVNSRILIIRTRKQGIPNFRKLPYSGL